MTLEFNEYYYLSRNPDVLHAVTNGQFSNGYLHYTMFGANELRNPNAIFNALEYAAGNPDVLTAVNAGLIPSVWDHYVHFGIVEGRLPSRAFADFDSASYLAANGDVAAAVASGTFANALQHYVQFGIAEGRPITRSDDIQLTHGTDTLTGTRFNAGLVYTPGGNDRVNSLQDEDWLTGIGLNPTLTATLGDANDNGATIVSPTLTGIATINAAFTGSNPLTATDTLNLEFATGLQAINVTRLPGTGIATLDRIQSAETGTLSIAAIQDLATVRFLYQDHALSGTNDSASLTLKGATMTEVAVRGRDGASGFESLTLTSQGSQNLVGSLITPQLSQLVINGDQDLVLFNASSDADQRTVHIAPAISNDGGGPAGLALVDASAQTGRLILDLTGHTGAQPIITDAGKAGYVAVKGGSADDRFVIAETVTDSGISIDGGSGTDSLLLMRSLTDNPGTTQKASISSIETLIALASSAGTLEVDTNLISDLSGIVLRNESLPVGTVTFDLDALSAKAASNITLAHGASGTNGVTQTVLDLQLADASGASDLVSITIGDAANTDQRFNFTLTGQAMVPAGADASRHVIENLTLIDADTESNSIAVTRINQYTDNLTLMGGVAGQFLNLDAVGNVYGYDQSSLAVSATALDPVVTDKTVGSVISTASLTDTDLIIAKLVSAIDYAGDLTLRVGQADQKILLGSGNNTVVFNNTVDFSLADSISGGTGTDTIILDGTSSQRVGASEWGNLSGVDVIRLAGAAGADFTLTVTDHLVDQSDAGNRVTIINNDGLLATAQNAATIHFTGISGSNALTFIGGNGDGSHTPGTQTVVLDDASAHGNNILDGGDRDVNAATGNLNILRIQNSANITSGDLQQVKNFGTIDAVNSTASAQTLTLSLTDGVVDALVDAGHAASALAPETLIIRALPNSLLPSATSSLNITAGDLTAKSNLNILADRVANSITTGAGDDTVVLLGNFVSGIYAADNIWGNSIDRLANNVAGARIVTDSLHFGGGDNDQLIVWGAANLTGVIGSGLDTAIQAYSKLVVNASQLAPGGVFERGIDFLSNMDHVLVIIDDLSDNNAIDLTKIIVSQGSLYYYIYGSDGHTLIGSPSIAPGNIGGIAVQDNSLTPTNLDPSLVLRVMPGATWFDTRDGTGIIDGKFAGTAHEVIMATAAQAANSDTFIDGKGGTNRLILTDGSSAAALNLNNSKGFTNIQVLELSDGYSNSGLTLPDTSGLLVQNTSDNAATVILGNVPQSYIGGSATNTVTLGSAGQNVSGGDNDDIFKATLSQIVGSTISGGAGNDRLILSGAGTVDLAGVVSGIEELVIIEPSSTSEIALADGITRLSSVNESAIAVPLILSMTADQADKLAQLQLGNIGGSQSIEITSGGVIDFSNNADVSFSNLREINFSNAGNKVSIDVSQLHAIGVGTTGKNLNAGSASTDSITIFNANAGFTITKVIGFETITVHGTNPVMQFVSGGALHTLDQIVEINATAVTGKIEIQGVNETTARLSITGSDGNDSITGGHRSDTIYGGVGDDTINGSYGNDVIFGDDGNDLILGSFGNDLLIGGNGNDTLSGGEDGLDTLTGGAGNDVFLTSIKHINYSLAALTIISDYRDGDLIRHHYIDSFKTATGSGLDTTGGVSISNGIVTGIDNVTTFLSWLATWSDPQAETLAWSDGQNSYLAISNGVSTGPEANYDNLFRLDGLVVTGMDIGTNLMALEFTLV